MNKREIKKYFVDILARMAQVVFTLIVVTPFIANIFNWNTFLLGAMVFVIIVVGGAIISLSIEGA